MESQDNLKYLAIINYTSNELMTEFSKSSSEKNNVFTLFYYSIVTLY